MVVVPLLLGLPLEEERPHEELEVIGSLPLAMPCLGGMWVPLGRRNFLAFVVVVLLVVVGKDPFQILMLDQRLNLQE